MCKRFHLRLGVVRNWQNLKGMGLIESPLAIGDLEGNSGTLVVPSYSLYFPNLETHSLAWCEESQVKIRRSS